MEKVSLVAHSQALLGNVDLQAGACLVGSQSGDWELAQNIFHAEIANFIANNRVFWDKSLLISPFVRKTLVEIS
jgi:hypothetical protein